MTFSALHRKQTVTLPQFGVFDDIHFGIKVKTIILQDSAPGLRLDDLRQNVLRKSRASKPWRIRSSFCRSHPTTTASELVFAQECRPSQHSGIYGKSRPRKKMVKPHAACNGDHERSPIGYQAIDILVKNGTVTLERTSIFPGI
jgi:hypothetical protein